MPQLTPTILQAISDRRAASRPVPPVAVAPEFAVDVASSTSAMTKQPIIDRLGITEYEFPGGRIHQEGVEFDIREYVFRTGSPETPGPDYTVSAAVHGLGTSTARFHLELDSPVRIVQTRGTLPQGQPGIVLATAYTTDPNIVIGDNLGMLIPIIEGPYFHNKALWASDLYPDVMVTRCEFFSADPQGQIRANNGIFQLMTLWRVTGG